MACSFLDGREITDDSILQRTAVVCSVGLEQVVSEQLNMSSRNV